MAAFLGKPRHSSTRALPCRPQGHSPVKSGVDGAGSWMDAWALVALNACGGTPDACGGHCRRRPSRHHLRANQRSQFTIVSPHTLAMSQACLAPQRATCGVRPRHRGGRQPRVAAAASSQSQQQREAGGATPAARVAPPAAATRVSVAIRQCARFPCPRNPYPCRIHKSGWCACPGVCGGLDGGIGCCGDCGSKSRWL